MKLNRLFVLVVALLVAAAAQAEPPAPDNAKALTVRTFTLKYKDVDKGASIVKPLLSSEGTVAIQPGTKSLVVTDRAENLKTIAKAVGEFDIAPQTFRLSVRLVSAAKGPGEGMKASDDIKDLAPKLEMMRGYNSFESAGQAEFQGKEGDPGIVEMPTGYRADFKFGEYDPASDSIKLSDFHLSRLQADQLAPLLKTTLNLRLGLTYVVGATRSAQSQRALMIVLVAHR
jgi:general secretion pathway protein D